MYHYITSKTGNYSLLKENAKNNRRNMTQAESVLWNILRGKQLLGYRFRRQHPICDFIVDFACLPLNLIIEVDGEYHEQEAQMSLDKEREKILQKQGFTIIRFTNNEVLGDTHNVINKIKEVMENINNNEASSPLIEGDIDGAGVKNPSQASSPLLGRGRGSLLIISAPSGSGKSTIINWLMKEHPELNMHFSISCTSRKPRGAEQNGVEYFFLTPEEFREKIANDEFLEYEEVYADCYYGTLKSQVEKQLEAGQMVVFDVDVNGAMNIKKAYGDKAMSLFIQPPSVEELRRRLEGRATDAQEVIEKRLKRAEYELSFADKFDNVVINDDLETARQEAYNVIVKC